MKTKIVKRKVFDDPTPNGIINLRYIRHTLEISKFTDLSNSEKNKLFDIILLVGKKLAIVWTHYRKYSNLESNLIENSKRNPISKKQDVVEIDHSQELFFEFDEFLVQLKSCLDYLVKIPNPLLGARIWGIHTFGAKGQDVIHVLKNNLPQKYKHFSKLLINIIANNNDWLNSTIEARDKINHFLDGGINYEDFAVYSLIDNKKVVLHRPMWSQEQSVMAFMDVGWINLFALCENFTCSSLGFRLKSNFSLFHGEENTNSNHSPWIVTTKELMESEVKKPGWRKI